jgi:predicted YcjX-like family ATPase
VVLTDIVDRMGRGVESAGGGLSEWLFEPSLRLGVTGLSRAGKTVFITSLVANLIDRGRMPQLRAAAEGAITAAWLRPQPDDTVPRFAYEAHMDALAAAAPDWPASTRHVSQLRLSLTLSRDGLWRGITGLGGLAGPRRLHLDIVDYPGEWLLDLGLMGKSYDAWSAGVLDRARRRPSLAGPYLDALGAADPAAPLDESVAEGLARAYADYLRAARGAGLSDCTPGRFLLPGEMAGSPALTFAPMPAAEAGRGSLRRELDRRYEAYKEGVVKPFFRNHFSRIDRQVVLADVLGAVAAGPEAVGEMRAALADTMAAFRPGPNSWLAPIIGKRVERILFAATKADYLHHTQHPQLTAIAEALLRDARDRARYAGAKTAALSLAALRATVETTVSRNGTEVACVRGRQAATGREVALHAGSLPDDPAAILGPATENAPRWLDADYRLMDFAPPRFTRHDGNGPPHIRLDRAAEFLIGDKLL